MSDIHVNYNHTFYYYFNLKPKLKTIEEEDVNSAAPGVPKVQQTTTSTTLPPPPSNTIDDPSSGNGVYISPNSHPERTSSFFAQPGILAGNVMIGYTKYL